MNNTHPHLEGLIPMSNVTETLILEAVARGWCDPTNAHKVVDPELAQAITREVVAALAALPGGGVDWIEGAPTESGWYWHWDGEVFRMHFVFNRPGHAYLCTEGEPYGPGQKRNFQAVQRMGGRWSAQVKTPSLPTPHPHEADQ